MSTPHTSSKPWYKEPWPWLLISGPLIVVIAGIVTFQIALSTDDGLVSDDYYKEGKEINLVLKRDEAAKAMHLTAQVKFSNDFQQVFVRPFSQRPLPDSLILSLIHPTQDKQDKRVILKKQADGWYQASIQFIQAAHWYIRLEDPQGVWRIQTDWRPEMGPTLMLAAPNT